MLIIWPIISASNVTEYKWQLHVNWVTRKPTGPLSDQNGLQCTSEDWHEYAAEKTSLWVAYREQTNQW